MIVAKDSVKNYINSQVSVVELAERLGVAHSTLYGVAKGNPVSAEIIDKLLEVTGFDFEKGFDRTEDK